MFLVQQCKTKQLKLLETKINFTNQVNINYVNDHINKQGERDSTNNKMIKLS